MMLTGFAIFSITSNPHQITKKYAALICVLTRSDAISVPTSLFCNESSITS